MSKILSRLFHQMKSQPMFWALLCAGVGFCWPASLVELLFDGNWNSLYLTGDTRPIPMVLANDGVYQHENSDGYDGQFYHHVAHDPLLVKGLNPFVDLPVTRWRRVLVPGLAATISLGHDEWTDTAYRAVILLCVFLGCYWLGCLAVHFGHPAIWGVSFMFIPPMTFALNRMTVDIALVALCVGYVLYQFEDRPKLVWAILVLAPLARETGVALIAIHSASGVWNRRKGQVVASVACILPWVGWVMYVGRHTEPRVAPTDWIALPLEGLIVRTAMALQGPLLSGGQTVVLNALSLLAVWAALTCTVVLLWQRTRRGGLQSLDVIDFGLAAFAMGAVVLGSPYLWLEHHAFVRLLAPLFLFLIAASLRSSKRWPLIPVVLLLPWLAMESLTYTSLMYRALRSLAG